MKAKQGELFKKETKQKKQLPEIDFEGKIVKPSKAGFYRCPYSCHRADYPQPKWKTENGFRKHMESCSGKPSAKKKAEEARNARLSEYIEKGNLMISKFLSEYPIGSEIFISAYYVTKPTHVQRGNRMVKVRYEEERKYFARKVTVQTVHPNRATFADFNINNSYWKSDIEIFSSMKEAESHASKRQKSYDESCHFASMCR